MSYDILLFDADNTLFDFSASEKQVFLSICANFNVKPTQENYELYKKINNENWIMFEKGLIEKSKLLVNRYNQLFQALNISGDAVKFNQTFLDTLSTSSILYDETESVIKKLYQMGKRLFIVTNGVTNVQVGRFSLSPINKYFEKVFISEQIGVGKPHKEFFDYVKSNIKNYDNDKAIVIGDSLTSDIKGANDSNIKCVWLNKKNILKNDLYKIDYTINNLTQLFDII